MLEGIEQKAKNWLEPVLEKNGALAVIEQITPNPSTNRMQFVFSTRPKEVSRKLLGDVYYQVVASSIEEAFEIESKLVLISEDAWEADSIKFEVSIPVLEQALITGTAFELRLVPGDYVSMTGWGRSGPGWPKIHPLKATMSWVRWSRTTGIVIRGPAHSGDNATIILLSTTEEWRRAWIGFSISSDGGFKNYRRLRPGVDFQDNLRSLSCAAASCADRVAAKTQLAKSFLPRRK